MLHEPLPLIQERNSAGRRGVGPPAAPEDERRQARAAIPSNLRRKSPPALPEVSELEAVRHFTRLSQRNYSIDGQFYPLGSCTMKYNPRFNEAMAALPGFSAIHPLQDDEDVQGMLEVMHELQEVLKKVIGLGESTLAPAAGAQGEYVGMSIIRAWHLDRKTGRDVVLIPDSAHGTNPASAALAGFKVRAIKTGDDGAVDLEDLKSKIDDSTAGIMLTNPNTCGVFEKDIREIANLIHDAGGLLYYDGANLNAIVGRARPGDMGFDVVHLNLHKTFSTPHGGGGPGAGAVGVSSELAEYLPAPHVQKSDDGMFRMVTPPKSIGKVMAFHGNAGVLVRALAYAIRQGGQGLWDVATMSVLNANYVLANIPEVYERPYGSLCKHEALVTIRHATKDHGIKAFDVAKRLLDLGFHAPTIYFPIHVHECLLIEPTETESKDTLDKFIAAMKQMADEMITNPEALHAAPQALPTERLDDVKAVKELNVCCKWEYSES